METTFASAKIRSFDSVYFTVAFVWIILVVRDITGALIQDALHFTPLSPGHTHIHSHLDGSWIICKMLAQPSEAIRCIPLKDTLTGGAGDRSVNPVICG